MHAEQVDMEAKQAVLGRGHDHDHGHKASCTNKRQSPQSWRSMGSKDKWTASRGARMWRRETSALPTERGGSS